MSEKKTGLALLREPFPEHQISKKPKPYKKESPKGNCPECGGYHGLPAMHLDYVGHAALTHRLLDADPNWNWAPPTRDELECLPPAGKNGMWIKLTVCGVSRFGYGDAGEKAGGDAIKEIIGDALRNAAMRFGAALDLWHKGQLTVDEEEPQPEFLTGEALADHIKSVEQKLAACIKPEALDLLWQESAVGLDEATTKALAKKFKLRQKELSAAQPAAETK